jgi:predicted phosphodiesterase
MKTNRIQKKTGIGESDGMARHNFLKNFFVVLVGLVAISLQNGCGPTQTEAVVQFGICADVHKDVIHDADRRLRIFVDEMNRQDVGFIVQLGDFCRPYEKNRGFMDIWNSFKGKGYHVLGNHDTDGGFTREQTVEFWESNGKYYSFDVTGYHFVVLDGNDRHEGAAGGYPRYIGPEQAKWLEDDLKNTELLTFLFSHQSLENTGGLENGDEIRAILEKANEQAGFKKVVASFSGHHHTDFHKEIAGIHYIQINSMSYQWVGEKYRYVRFSEEIEKANPWVSFTVPYKEPLYAVVTLRGNSVIEIEGTKTEYIEPSPEELGCPEQPEGSRYSTEISGRLLGFD